MRKKARYSSRRRILNRLGYQFSNRFLWNILFPPDTNIQAAIPLLIEFTLLIRLILLLGFTLLIGLIFLLSVHHLQGLIQSHIHHTFLLHDIPDISFSKSL